MAGREADDGGMTLGRMLFSPKGRIPRFDALFCCACLWTMLAAAALVWNGWVFAYYHDDLAALMRLAPWLFLAALVFPTVWTIACVLAKRCHDRDRSAWFLLLALIPIVNLWPMVELVFLHGTRAANRFGPEPEGMASQWRAVNEDR